MRAEELMGGAVLSRPIQRGLAMVWFDRACQKYQLRIPQGGTLSVLYEYGSYQALEDAVWEKLDDSDLSQWQAVTAK